MGEEEEEPEELADGGRHRRKGQRELPGGAPLMRQPHDNCIFHLFAREIKNMATMIKTRTRKCKVRKGFPTRPLCHRDNPTGRDICYARFRSTALSTLAPASEDRNWIWAPQDSPAVARD